MKPSVLILPIIIYLIVGCSQQSDVTNPLSPAVDSLVTKFIKTKAKTGLIYVAFDKIDNKDYLIISDIETYDDRFVDGYFTHAGKTIAYCSYDTEDSPDFFDINVFKKGGITRYINPRTNNYKQGAHPTSNARHTWWDFFIPFSVAGPIAFFGLILL